MCSSTHPPTHVCVCVCVLQPTWHISLLHLKIDLVSNSPFGKSSPQSLTHIHYIYICVCVCVCVVKPTLHTSLLHLKIGLVSYSPMGKSIRTIHHTRVYIHIYIYIYIYICVCVCVCVLKLIWHAAAGIDLHVNAHKTEYMCVNQRGDFSTLYGSSLKLVTKFTYLVAVSHQLKKTSTCG